MSEARNGLIEAVQVPVGFAEIGMNGGIVRRDRGGTADQFHRHCVTPELMRDYAQIVLGVDTMGIECEDFLVECLGHRQASRLVVLDRELQSLRDVEFSHGDKLRC